MTADSPQEFYDGFAEDYHLIYPDWQSSTRRQGGEVRNLITSIKGPGAFSVLDCSCGIGTQAVGLALEGYAVHATDVSPRAIERAAASAKALGAEVTFGTADFRHLDEQVDGTFDVVLSFDNSLAHLLTDADLAQAFAAMKSKLGPDGLLLISLRDYEAMVKEKPEGSVPRVMDLGDRKRIYFQTWQWHDDAPVYTTDFYVLKESGTGWDVTTGRTTLRALDKETVLRLLEEAGFTDIAWLLPHESGYHQPVVSARSL
ncbi:hypothetical protein GCM10009745_43300 [Kribbella yunnanensis]|uniref:Methyltransferase domain-containing protein n=1 Tax=Kribbella yunnanensis TaxID=190194 RepID=A0ABP4TU57_9ACTN